ncbi:MAG: rod shape-determining protein RodA [Pseudomonadota bacterium]
MPLPTAIHLPSGRRGMRDYLGRLHWPLILMLSAIATAGVLTLYSVAGGSWTPWALKHGIRYVVALGAMITMGFIAIRYWMALSYPIYGAALIALALVPVIGATNMGAQRWIEFGSFQFQPSEAMKIGLVMALARYYHGLRAEQVSHILFLIPPLMMIGAPVALVFMQPDLGTSLLLAATGASIVLLAGLSWRIAFFGAMSGVVGGYAAYRFEILKPYQLERIFTFLNPDRDPLGQGYHLLQSKIGFGSGGLTGKGYMQGTQSQLKFLPEMHTDFIFTIFGEEFGFVGAMVLLSLYVGVILAGVGVAMRARSHFARLTCMGVVVTFALYVLINTGMVMGLAPVVGVPLPLVSYGGTVMLTIMAGFGLVMSAFASRDPESQRGLV